MKSISLIIRINTGSTLTVLNQVLKLYEDDTWYISFNIPNLNSGQTLEVLGSTSDINRGAITMTIQNQNSGVNCINLLFYFYFNFHSDII